MSRRFTDWHEAHAYAQAEANRYGRSFGIRRQREYGKDGFNVSMLPRADKRFGSELMAEVVDPMRRAPQHP